MVSGSSVSHQLPWPDGCGLAPFETSLPGFPLFDGPNPLGAIRSSNSSTSSCFTSSWSFIGFVVFVVLPAFRIRTNEPAGPYGSCIRVTQSPGLRLRKETRRKRIRSGLKNSVTGRYFTAGAFVPWIVRVVERRVVVSRIAGRARRDPFLQLFYFEQDLVFHLVSP